MEFYANKYVLLLREPMHICIMREKKMIDWIAIFYVSMNYILFCLIIEFRKNFYWMYSQCCRSVGVPSGIVIKTIIFSLIIIIIKINFGKLNIKHTNWKYQYRNTIKLNIILNEIYAFEYDLPKNEYSLRTDLYENIIDFWKVLEKK